jgi:hypothetical protein
VTVTRNELQRQSGKEGGVGRPEATRLEVLGAAWGPESAPTAGGRNRARARGLGIFHVTRGPDHKERWKPTGGPQWLTGPTRQWRTEREREWVERVYDTGRVGWSGSGPLRRK